jgi:hypothetical protein
VELDGKLYCFAIAKNTQIYEQRIHSATAIKAAVRASDYQAAIAAGVGSNARVTERAADKAIKGLDLETDVKNEMQRTAQKMVIEERSNAASKLRKYAKAPPP